MAARFYGSLKSIPNKNTRDSIMTAIRDLAGDPKPFPPNPKLDMPITISSRVAQYRIVVGDYRIFYDVNDALKKVYIIALRLRNEKTYRG